VKIVEITINARQLIAMIWTLIAIVLSVIIVVGFGIPNWTTDGLPFLIIAAFFLVWLIIALPVYLLIALWGVASKSETE
jgi:Zn-dependent protease with chaperone function